MAPDWHEFSPNCAADKVGGVLSSCKPRTYVREVARLDVDVVYPRTHEGRRDSNGRSLAASAAGEQTTFSFFLGRLISILGGSAHYGYDVL